MTQPGALQDEAKPTSVTDTLMLLERWDTAQGMANSELLTGKQKSSW